MSKVVAEIPLPTAPALHQDRYPTLHAIGLGPSLAAVERVAAWAQRGKHPGPKWATQTIMHQVGKLLGHMRNGMLGESVDEDTGEHPYAHVAARALMLLGLALQKPEIESEEPSRLARSSQND